MSAIHVLDHGLIDLQSSTDQGMNLDNLVSECARVADGSKESRTEEQDQKLLTYMLKNGHTSPFEHVSFTFYVKAPIFVLRQWQRHRTWSFNETSGRYKELPTEFYIPKIEDVGVQDTKNHQSRDRTKYNDSARDFCRRLEQLSIWNATDYKHALDIGIPRELARLMLPTNLYTDMYATVDLHNLLKFISMREDEHAQYEIQCYAVALRCLIEPLVPRTIKAAEDAGILKKMLT